MVLVRTNVTEEVYARLLNDEEVEAITNFDKVGFQESYRFLKELSGFDNFFFGMAAESEPSEEISDLCSVSTSGNVVKLLLDIPESEIVATEYYQFTDLIYYTEHEVDDEIADRLREYMLEHKDSYNFDSSDTEIIQVIYKSIKPECILEVK